MKVMKFGGTSMGTCERVFAVTDIVLEAAVHQPVMVVVSAAAGVTNSLIQAIDDCIQNPDFSVTEFVWTLTGFHCDLVTDHSETGSLKREVERELTELGALLEFRLSLVQAQRALLVRPALRYSVTAKDSRASY